jgi:hypothetical protein
MIRISTILAILIALLPTALAQQHRKTHYPDGKLKSDCGLNEHGRHGKCQEWYPNGQKRLAATYQDGKLHGLVQVWNKSGKLVGEGLFENNLAVGSFKYQFPSESKPSTRSGISLIRLEAQESHRNYPTSIATDKFEVLDINVKKGLAAFKHTYRIVVDSHEGDEIEYKAVRCQYAGMQEFPTSGVILGIYDLNHSEIVSHFVVYYSVVDKANCTSHAKSKQTLTQAKAFFSNLGLDINKRPQPLKPTSNQANSMTYKLPNGTAKWLYDSYHYGDLPTPTEDPVVNMYAELYTIDHSVNSVTFSINNKIAYKRYANDYLVMGGRGQWQLVGVYKIKNHLVVVDRYTYGSGLGGTMDLVVFSEILEVK